MPKKYFYSFIYLLLIFSFANCFSYEIQTEFYNSVSHIEKDKAYLKQGGITLLENAIFIYVQGQPVSISTLKTDEKGLYFDLNSATYAWDVPPLCPLCGSPLVVFWCPNPKCPNYGN